MIGRMKRGTALVLVVLMGAGWGTFAGVRANEDGEVILEGEVKRVVNYGKETVMGELVDFQELEIEIVRGGRKGEAVVVRNQADAMMTGPVPYQEYAASDKVRVSEVEYIDGEVSYHVVGELKRPAVLVLVGLFVGVVLVVGRLWGALSIVGLVVSFGVIFKMVVPMIIGGWDPVLAASLGSAIIIPTTFYISHGFNKKTHVGVLATFISLLVTGFLAAYFVEAAHLTGFASEEAGFLQVERRGTIDIRGLLLAGMIIGTLGILDDVTVGQSSTVQQLKKSNKKARFQELFVQGMKVGQDHISSMVNTLVLVYSGSALPLLLLFFGSEKSYVEVIEFELIAEEIVRMMVGSIGLVLAAPLATAMAAGWYARED